jgi:hypothetical protein
MTVATGGYARPSPGQTGSMTARSDQERPSASRLAGAVDHGGAPNLGAGAQAWVATVGNYSEGNLRNRRKASDYGIQLQAEQRASPTVVRASAPRVLLSTVEN